MLDLSLFLATLIKSCVTYKDGVFEHVRAQYRLSWQFKYLAHFYRKSWGSYHTFTLPTQAKNVGAGSLGSVGNISNLKSLGKYVRYILSTKL